MGAIELARKTRHSAPHFHNSPAVRRLTPFPGVSQSRYGRGRYPTWWSNSTDWRARADRVDKDSNVLSTPIANYSNYLRNRRVPRLTAVDAKGRPAGSVCMLTQRPMMRVNGVLVQVGGNETDSACVRCGLDAAAHKHPVILGAPTTLGHGAT